MNIIDKTDEEILEIAIPWWEDLCDGDKPFIQNGCMAVSEKPGLGVELNDKVAKTLLWNGDTYFD